MRFYRRVTLVLLVFLLFTVFLRASGMVVTPKAAATGPACLGRLHVGAPAVDCGGGARPAATDTLDATQQAAILTRIKRNLQTLALQKRLPPRRSETVALQWPLRPAASWTGLGYYGISNFVDHGNGQLQDYMCNQRTYQGHNGTDFFLSPFAWLMMDNQAVEVVTAAAGIIVEKQDGHFDRSCTSNNDPWNAVYVRQEDGSIAWYGHLKNGSLTSKSVGDAVGVGEYLGLVGSSGSSTEPHLHFELRAADDTVIDPYAGACSTETSWWASQPAYYEPRITLVTTGLQEPQIPACPQPEQPNSQTRFDPGATIYFSTYYRDQQAGQSGEYTIYRPDGSIFQRWEHSAPEPHYAESWWWWNYTIDAGQPTGVWHFVINFAGQSYSNAFTLGDAAPVFTQALYLPLIIKE